MLGRSCNRVDIQIGINYIGQKRELHGCINDIKNVKRFLTRKSFVVTVNTALTPSSFRPVGFQRGGYRHVNGSDHEPSTDAYKKEHDRCYEMACQGRQTT